MIGICGLKYPVILVYFNVQKMFHNKMYIFVIKIPFWQLWPPRHKCFVFRFSVKVYSLVTVAHSRACATAPFALRCCDVCSAPAMGTHYRTGIPPNRSDNSLNTTEKNGTARLCWIIYVTLKHTTMIFKVLTYCSLLGFFLHLWMKL